MKDQCILIPLGYRETRSEVTPNQTEDSIKQSDKCENPIECLAIVETTSTDSCPCPSDPSLLQQDPRKDGLCKYSIITSTTSVNSYPYPTDINKLASDPRRNGLCNCAVITETTSIQACACPTDPNLLALDPLIDGLCKVEKDYQMKLYNYFVNKSSGNDNLLNGQSESKPTRTIEYTIKILIGNINQLREATLNVAAENYSENIELTSKKPGINVIYFIGVSNDRTNTSFPVLSNSAHPGQSALNIVDISVLVQHFIFAYIPPLSVVSTIAPMISIKAGSISEWNKSASGQRNIVLNYLTHSFTDCIFQGRNFDYGSGQKYGNTIGPLLSIIGTRVTIDNCQFNSKENIQLLKGIPSAIISAVFLYPDSGITINNCNFLNLTQSSQISETALKETGILNLTGND
ncbi:MAG: hypothetical protein EZS28_047626, partial [Streblomastix strix]